jgi:hydrogenase maturation protein HypF
LPLPVRGDGATVLGTGAELKSTVCLLKGGQAFVGPHVGDLKNLETYSFFRETVDHMARLFDATPELVAHDLHPEYLSTRWAQEQGYWPAIAVQHHHAHLAACLAENDIEEPVVGLIMDGTGYGDDGTIWGGEILAGDARGYERIGHFEAMPLPGGDAAIKAPWRTAVAYLQEAFGSAIPELPFLRQHDWKAVAEMAAARFNSPVTSSCGRFFDAVAVMAGGRQIIDYEAQSAIEFMEAAGDSGKNSFPFELVAEGGMLIMPVRSIVCAVAEAVIEGIDLPAISTVFHRTLADMFTQAACWALKATGLRHVVLSGGVFQNRLLLEEVIKKFNRQGISVYTHSKLPAGDGCISVGQAVIGRAFCRGK